MAAADAIRFREFKNQTEKSVRHWIQAPHAIEQHTAMPEMNVTDQDSRDIAGYLYTLH